ncbi:SDR family NAD(P)-dependent oxidoreductase [Ornithinimicrobium pratense]|uniref:SDR family oxidoreductase n=1 Tax=Ornithinimicrobium pratense TaxID=2593973 RepID=A0A5J6V3J2_9MICO|nr:SDR family oxidoreductase [Ornithinimicrobium pratense]QFG67731.1 SDR family oxidoreductase [Ornithinimicrobium pratense]
MPPTDPSTTPVISPVDPIPAAPRPVALVMGASRGLGLLIARELVEREHRVVICSRTLADLQTARNQLLARRPDAQVDVRACDVSDRAAVQELVQEVESGVGPIEVLITVAGVIQVGPAESMTFDHFDASLGTMLHGPVNVTLPVVRRMRERGHGRIGTITSIGGEVTPPHLWPYAVAKSGAVAFSEGLSAELSGTGVTATTVVPGLMRTGSHERAHFTGQAAKEFAWFGPAASIPGLTMSADRAARKIVDAVLAGETRCELTPLTVVATRFRGLLPGVTTKMMGLTTRLLPSASGPGETIEGRDAQRRLGSSVVNALTTLGRRAAERNNERRPTTQAQEP